MASSKKQTRKAERKAAARQISSAAANQQQGGVIPAKVALQPTLPDTMMNLDGSEYQLVFQNYNNDDCELHKLDKADAKALVKKFAAITSFNSTSIKSTNLVRDKVEPTGAYESLYKGLEPDIELREIKFHETGRIMAYFIDNHMYAERAASYCCVVAVLTKHRST